uniref:4'-phosphopantetheinyl transferase family protein n=1 Tax=Promineifilum sp. TaxID=2664178 RepID=UPI0035AF3554
MNRLTTYPTNRPPALPLPAGGLLSSYNPATMYGEAHSGSLTTPGGAIYWLCQNGAAHASPDTTGGSLSPEELAAFAALKTDKRRRDWLLGRLTAKRLLRRVLADLGHDLPPDGIVVLRHADGWPQVSLPALGDAAPALTLSISHAGKWAFCAAMLGESRPLGCDIEAIEPRSDGFIEDYFTAAERELVAQAFSLHHVYANAIWSGKEAALKAIRRGLAEDTR